MLPRIGEVRIATPLKMAVVILLTVFVLFLRRPGQFSHPYLWVEDGAETLKSFADHGPYILIEPLNGYEVLATKILSYIAFRSSILWAPEIEVVLAILATCAVLLAIAFSPTHLRYRSLCAVMPLLVPTSAEVFTTSAYVFWWVGILLLLVLLWREEMQGLRFLFVVLGGFSSPLILPVAPALLVRAVWERSRREVMIAGTAILIAAVQYAILRTAGAAGNASPINFETFATAVDKLVGFFIVGALTMDDTKYYGLGFLIGAVLLALAWTVRKRLDRHFIFLLVGYVLICGAMVWKIPVDTIDPLGAGERYFFYPFIMLMWGAIWIASVSDAAVAVLFAAILAFSLISSGHFLWFDQGRLDWRGFITACAISGSDHISDIPIYHYNGYPKHWDLKLTGAECRRLIDRSIF